MKANKLELLKLELESIENEIVSFEKSQSDFLENVHDQFKESAQNLLHYLALRKKKRVRIQRHQGNLRHEEALLNVFYHVARRRIKSFFRRSLVS